MNCKFKFHLRAALPRGAAGAGWAPLKWAGLPDWLRLVEALPNLVGTAGPVGSACRWDAFYCFTHPPGSRSKTEFFGFAGRRARTAPAGGLLFPDFQVHGSRSKTEFIDFAGRRARTAPAGELLFSDLQVHGSRSKTEFISFAGRRARTGPAPGLLFPDFQVCGSRSKTEFISFAGRRARTAPAPEPRSDEKRCTEGPGVRASLPTIIFSKGKN